MRSVLATTSNGSALSIFLLSPARPKVRGVCGQAFRDQKLCASNDFLNDSRSLAWRRGAQAGQVGAAAALPLTCNGRGVGVLLVTLREAGSLNQQIISLFERMSANISYALDNFEREASRRRLSRMLAALSATNEAIVRAKSREELFGLICEAAVHGAKFNSASVALASPGSDLFYIAASSGADSIGMKSVNSRSLPRFPKDAVWQERRSEPSSRASAMTIWPTSAFFPGARMQSASALRRRPSCRWSMAVSRLACLIFNSTERDTFTPEMIELLWRLAENVSFALSNFDRIDEKSRIEDQKERVTRMLTALSATNEAIMRAKSRTELFELVCEAAVYGGKFTSTTIGIARTGND